MADGGKFDGVGYQGPPISTPPPPGWRPEVVVRPAPPRQLPPQDHPAIDAAEQLARRVTYAVGAGAGAVSLFTAVVLLARALSGA